MDLLFLHGAPAVGKLTVARAVLSLTPGRPFDNHVTLRMAEALFAFGAPGFWELVHGTRRLAVETAAQTDLPLMVMTNCYCDPESAPLYAGYKQIVTDYGGRVLPVYLTCDPDIMAHRVTEPDREERRKIGTADTLQDHLSRNNIAPVPDEACIHLSTDNTPPLDTARKIIEAFALR